MSETTFIYALCEPGTRTVRYIGKANDPKKRLKRHLQKSGSVKYENRLGRWLRKVGVPALVILREVPIQDWEIAEERYIRLARGFRMDLVNSTSGGEGVHNPSIESRALLRESKLGVKNPNFGGVSLVTLAAATRANKGVKRSPEFRAKLVKANLGFTRAACRQFKRMPYFSDGGGI